VVETCPFCSYAGPSVILADYPAAYVIEPINPVCEGHVLVIPKRHVADFVDDPIIAGHVVMCAVTYMRSLRERSGEAIPDLNLITSKGAAATQTVEHLHFHLVPRREGDGLFLPWSVR
jgi:histidine triad (HIT) family protein